jgi:transposase-like protein
MMTNEIPEDVKRWTAKRRQALVLQILRGETTAVEAARQHGLTVGEIEAWQEKAMAAMENSLRSQPRDEEGQKEEEIKRLKQKVGELVMDLDIFSAVARMGKEAMRGHPFGRKMLNESDE